MGDGETGRWGDGETGRRGDGETGRRRGKAVGVTAWTAPHYGGSKMVGRCWAGHGGTTSTSRRAHGWPHGKTEERMSRRASQRPAWHGHSYGWSHRPRTADKTGQNQTQVNRIPLHLLVLALPAHLGPTVEVPEPRERAYHRISSTNQRTISMGAT